MNQDKSALLSITDFYLQQAGLSLLRASTENVSYLHLLYEQVVQILKHETTVIQRPPI